MNWTAERRQLFHQMWERGDKAPAIAAALGCKAGAVNVARARFGLKPRRIVSGRPKEPDEPAHKIERVAFTTSRLAEYCSEKELVAQTGHELGDWPRVIVKELVDNGLDHCEELGSRRSSRSRSPPASVASRRASWWPITVAAFRAPPSPASSITRRVSSREAYVSPTRGRQGNALKTILPMSFLLGGKVKGETWIEARGRKHRLIFSINAIKLEPIVRNISSRSRVRTGTKVTMFWPDCYRGADRCRRDRRAAHSICLGQSAPDVSLRHGRQDRDRLKASNPDWTKYRACDATSAHWYALEQFERYAGAMIDRDQKVTVREFAAQFRGMSATERQKQVVHEVGASHLSLRRFFGSETAVNHQRMEKLLLLLQQHTRPVRPELLGVIGEEHFRNCASPPAVSPRASNISSARNTMKTAARM